MSDVLDILFPIDISYGAKGGSEFSTGIVETQGGFEQRLIKWPIPKRKYDVSNNAMTEEQAWALQSFFNNVMGKGNAFLFKDWCDYTAEEQLIGYGDGAKAAFQAHKSYTVGSNTVWRTIHKLDTVSAVFVDSVPVAPGGFTFNASTGEITLTGSPPSEGEAVSATFTFFVPCRFDTDELQVSIDQHGIYSVSNLYIREIMLGELPL